MIESKLKSTYRPTGGPPLLVPGWTEHKAPTGHSYYYNASTKESTYIRPTTLPSLPAPAETLQGSSKLLSGVLGLEDQSSLSSQLYRDSTNSNYFQHHPYRWNGPKGGLRETNSSLPENRPLQVDRPKSKHTIPGCTPWILVKTRLGRRFVYNPEKEESFWKFPPDVMPFVIEFDRVEREKREKLGRGADSEPKVSQEIIHTEDIVAPEVRSTRPALPPNITTNVEDDSDDYEDVEVEFTDDEDEENPSKRVKLNKDNAEEPVEFNEGDIAYQLAAMGQDYGLDRGEYGDAAEDDLEEGAQGLPLTEEDTHALFKDMLNDHLINPYTPWDKVIDEGTIIEDDRYTVLPSMKARKDVWGDWSRDKIQQLKEEREKEELKDPRIQYLSFLQKHATPKLYWPEFRRKYKKEPELRDTKLPDKEREKWYRDYINRLKIPESSLKSDLTVLLKSLPLQVLNRSTNMEALPPRLLTDIRYVSLRSSIRNPMIEAYIMTLPSAPEQVDLSLVDEAELVKQKSERGRREKALAEREKKVEEEKRRQRGTLQHSKEMLRNGEEEIKRAMRVGKEGLMGHYETGEDSGTLPAQ